MCLGNEAPRLGKPVNLSDRSSQTLTPSSASSTSNITSTLTAKVHNSVSDNSNLAQSLISPINTLHLNIKHWVIKARVTAKSIRTWEITNGEGKLLTMDLMDDSGEIRATSRGKQCDKFCDIIKVNQVYLISKGQLKATNNIYLIKNDLEICFTNETVVQLCDPAVKYNLVAISEVANMKSGDAVDVVGICKAAGDIRIVNSRSTGKEMKKRDLVLIDTSNAAIILTLWEEDAVNFDGNIQPVILLKGARIDNFNGVNRLKLGYASNMKINPNIPEGEKLLNWFNNGGGKNIQKPTYAR